MFEEVAGFNVMMNLDDVSHLILSKILPRQMAYGLSLVIVLRTVCYGDEC